MADTEKRVLEATLKFDTDAQSANKAKGAVTAVTKETDKLAKAAEEANKKFEDMKKTAGDLKAVAGNFAAASAAILAPLTAAAAGFLATAEKYRELQKQGEALNEQQQRAVDTSDRWNSATERISESMARVGGVVITEVLPYLEQAAGFVEQAAAFAAANPQAIQAALVIGGSLAAIATLAMTVGTLMETYATIAAMLSAGGAVSSALAAISSPAVVAGIVAIAPLVVAVGALVALLNTEFGQGGLSAGQQIGALAQSMFYALTGEMEKAKLVMLDTAYAMNYLSDEEYAATAASIRAAEATRQKTDMEYRLVQAQTSQNGVMSAFLGTVVKVESAVSLAGMSLKQFSPLLNFVVDAISRIAGFRPQGQRAFGGYVNTGSYGLHSGEFVMTASTTKMLESSAGGRLDQRTIQGMTSITYNDHKRFDSSLSARDRQSIRSDIMGDFATALGRR